MFDENLEEFSCRRKTVRRPVLFFTILLVLQQTLRKFIEKSWRIQAIKRAFLKKLTFDLAKPAVGIRLKLFHQKHSVRSCGVLMGFPAPSVLAELPNTVKTSRIM